MQVHESLLKTFLKITDDHYRAIVLTLLSCLQFTYVLTLLSCLPYRPQLLELDYTSCERFAFGE